MIKATKIEKLANYLNTGCTDQTTALLGIEDTVVYQPIKIERITLIVAILNIVLAFGVMATTFILKQKENKLADKNKWIKSGNENAGMLRSSTQAFIVDEVANRADKVVQRLSRKTGKEKQPTVSKSSALPKQDDDVINEQPLQLK